jgi:hypothetical protein
MTVPMVNARGGYLAGKVLWIIQALLALTFLFAGGTKLVMPIQMLQGPVPLPELFIRFIGVAELAGAFGLVLPGLLRIRPDLTATAALGLIIIMSGATVLTLESGMFLPALIPVVVGSLAGFVAYGRTELAPIAGR